MVINKKIIIVVCIIILLLVISIILINDSNGDTVIQTNSSNILYYNKIEWGIKREKDNKQPDLGNKNKELIEKYNGLAMGNSDKKYIYLTFDEGYEAGYTGKILNVLRENNVKAVFFITAHYVNTASDIVKRMIDEGHIVGNHSPHSLMDV